MRAQKVDRNGVNHVPPDVRAMSQAGLRSRIGPQTAVRTNGPGRLPDATGDQQSYIACATVGIAFGIRRTKEPATAGCVEPGAMVRPTGDGHRHSENEFVLHLLLV